MGSLSQGCALLALSKCRQVVLTHIPLLAPLISEDGLGNFRSDMPGKAQFWVQPPPLRPRRCPEATNHFPMLPLLRPSKGLPWDLTILSSKQYQFQHASFLLHKTDLKNKFCYLYLVPLPRGNLGKFSNIILHIWLSNLIFTFWTSFYVHACTTPSLFSWSYNVAQNAYIIVSLPSSP